MSESGVVKLSDFGLSVQLEHSCFRRSSMCESWLYMAPEECETDAVLKSDVWSLGMSIIEMGEGKNPYARMTSEEFKDEVLNKPSPSLTSSRWSSCMIDFVKRCLVKDVNKRASVEDLLMVVLLLRYDD